MVQSTSKMGLLLASKLTVKGEQTIRFHAINFSANIHSLIVDFANHTGISQSMIDPHLILVPHFKQRLLPDQAIA